MSNVKPNSDAANEGSLAGGLKAFIESAFRDFEDMMPARVVSYDDATNRAVIKPLVMMGTTDGKKVARSAINNIPVFRFGGGGFFIRFPIKEGDFGWLKANDRDISLVLQRGGLEDWPNTKRLHSFSDAMFFPDALKEWVIDGGNIDALVIQSMDGSVCISLHVGKLKMDAPEMEVNIPKTVWKGDIEYEGALQGNGRIDFTGDSFTHNGKDVGGGHKHGGVQPGSGNTDVPV